jgi:hypothetical protein
MRLSFEELTKGLLFKKQTGDTIIYYLVLNKSKYSAKVFWIRSDNVYYNFKATENDEFNYVSKLNIIDRRNITKLIFNERKKFA